MVKNIYKIGKKIYNILPVIFSNFPTRALDFPPGGWGRPYLFFMGGGSPIYFFEKLIASLWDSPIF